MKQNESIDEHDPVMKVFQSFGEARQNIRPDRLAAGIQDRIIIALQEEHGLERAADIAFHLSDWNHQFATLTALHLSPESFSDEDIQDLVEALKLDGVNHLMAATHLSSGKLIDVWDLGLKIEKP